MMMKVIGPSIFMTGLLVAAVLFKSAPAAVAFQVATPTSTFARRTISSSNIRPSPVVSSGRPAAGALKMSSPEEEALKLDPSQTALVLIEYQNEFTTPGGKMHEAVKPVMDKTNMLENSRKLMDHARWAGCTIIHMPIVFEEGHKEIAKKPYGVLANIKGGAAFQNKEWGAEICDTMKPGPTDLVAKGKSGLCGFHSTNLDFLLRQNDIKNVVIGGFLTNCCVESTMRSAYERGYKVYTLKDCCGAASQEAHDSTFEHNFVLFSKPVTSADIIAALPSPVAA